MTRGIGRNPLIWGGMVLGAVVVWTACPRTLLPPGLECKLDIDAPQFSLDVTEPGGNTLTLRRSKGWFNPGLGNGKWVGSAINRGPGPSAAYPAIVEGDTGCIKFQHQGGGDAKAWLHFKPGATKKLDVAVFCDHGTPNYPPDIKPRYEAIPEHCERLVMTAAPEGDSVGVTVELPRDPSTAEAVRGILTSAGLDASYAQAVATQLFLVGPWYPCASAGCCRAWGT